MGVLLPWGILMGFQAYAYGIKQQRMPEPYHFIWGSGAMVIAGIVYVANPRIGSLVAWALLLGAFTLAYTTAQQTQTQASQAQ